MVCFLNLCSADKLLTFSCHSLLSVSIDQLNKADALLTPEAYIYLLGKQCLVSLSNGLAVLCPLLIFGARTTDTSMIAYHMCTTGLLILHYWTTFGLDRYLDI